MPICLTYRLEVPAAKRHHYSINRSQWLAGLNCRPGASEVIYLYSWDVGKTGLEPAGLIEADKAVDHIGHPYVQMAQTLEAKYTWMKRTKTFVEWVAFYPTGAVAPDTLPQYYIHPGITYFVSNNIQLDAHLFIGLNKPATDFFGGPGLSIRF